MDSRFCNCLAAMAIFMLMFSTVNLMERFWRFSGFCPEKSLGTECSGATRSTPPPSTARPCGSASKIS